MEYQYIPIDIPYPIQMMEILWNIYGISMEYGMSIGLSMILVMEFLCLLGFVRDISWDVGISTGNLGIGNKTW